MSTEETIGSFEAQEPTAPETRAEATADQAPEIPWIETLPQAIRDLPELAGLADQEGFINRISDLAKARQAPEKYDFQVPEGMEVQQELLSQFETVAKDAGLSQDQAAKVLDMWHGLQTSTKSSMDKALQDATQSLQGEWGKDFESNVKLAHKAVERFGGKELAQYLDSSGMGNNLPLIKAFHAIGKAMSEDQTVGLDASSKPSAIDRWNGMPLLNFKM